MAKRSCVLGRPWFLLAVAVLVVNDQVWKADHPGWVTGKVSDVAGVAVVAALLAVVGGRRVGIWTTVVGFVALKCVPGVAELAAPILGGVTRRDPSDLLALAILPLVARTLPARNEGPTSQAPRSRSRIGAIGSAMVPILGAVAALFATTATSCGPSEPTVDAMVVDGGAVFAHLDGGYGTGRAPSDWARSDDGGRTWRAAPAPRGYETTTTTSTTGPFDETSTTSSTTPDPDIITDGGRPPAVDEDPLPPFESEACDRGVCYRIASGRVIQRASDPAGPWTTEFEASDRALAASDPVCAGVSGMGTVVLPGGPGEAVVSFGAAGVLVRDADGTWTRRSVLSADKEPPGPPPIGSPTFLSMVAMVPLGMVGVWLVGRGRTVSRAIALTLVPVGIVAILFFSVLRAIGGDGVTTFGRGQVIASVAVVLLAAGIARLSPLTPAVPPGVPGPPPVPGRPPFPGVGPGPSGRTQ